MTRRILSEASAESEDGYTITVRGFSEDSDLGAPRLANRGVVDFAITGPDGTYMKFRLPGSEAAEIVSPLVQGAVEHHSEGDVARFYLAEMGPFTPEQKADLERRAALD